jgi:hypothetical protein
MAEVWTRRSREKFSHVPLSSAGAAAVDIAFAIPSEWGDVLRYSDPTLAALVTGLAQRKVSIPEPGAEVGPDDSVWQVELAWPSAKVAVVADDDGERDAWLIRHGWTVSNAQGATNIGSLADDLSRQVGGST